MRAVNIRINHRKNPVGIDISNPFISWNCAEGISQTAYEIVAKADNEVVWNSSTVKTNRMNAVYRGEAVS